jgi:hypothetical protein
MGTVLLRREGEEQIGLCQFLDVSGVAEIETANSGEESRAIAQAIHVGD